ncbi:MAG TPA: TerC family protein [Vicinamibacteria bacterium]|nr:TerC family protein [Vicinamibacteria bacterium]
MSQVHLFPFAEYWWFYAAFTAFVVLLLLLDLGIFHRRAHAVSIKEASAWTAFWIVLSLVFNYLFYVYMLEAFPRDARLTAVPGFDPHAAAHRAALEFLAGYVVEKSLSVDNIFVFVVVLGYFAVPPMYQHRVLFLGIVGALVFRGIFIALGTVLIRYEWVVWLFGAFLIFTGVKMLFTEGETIEPDKNPILRFVRRHLPVTRDLHGQSFFVREGGKLHATPLFVTVLFVEMTDIVFAVDSVPAIFGLTREPLIVYTSNVFAILGLRAMYFVLAGAMDKFYLLRYGLGVVLAFVGLKMVWLNRLYEGHFPITTSLAVIVGVIIVSVVLSLVFPRGAKEPS